MEANRLPPDLDKSTMTEQEVIDVLRPPVNRAERRAAEKRKASASKRR